MVCSAVRRALCGCCVDAGARSYLRLLEGSRCAVTQQLLSVPEVQGFSAFECIKFMYLVQMDGDDEVWLPSLCARLLELFYDDAADVEAYTQQIGELMLSFPRPCVPLEIAVLHMAKRSVHFALRLYWMLSSTLQDAAQLPPSTSSRTRLAGKTRAGRMLLCLYAVIEERAKGCSGQHDTPHDYLQKIIEDHRGEAPALAAIASALCEVQAAGHGIAVSVPACPASPPSVLHLPSGAAALSGSEGTSVGAASSHTSGSEPDPAEADARCALGSVKLLLQQEHERRPSLCNSMSAQQEAPAEAGVESAEMAQRLLEWTAKQNLMHARGSFFSGECLFVEKLVQIAESLRVEQPHLRPARLVVMLTRINALLAAHPVYIPFGTSQQDVRQVVRIPPEHAKVFTTACRTPCWLVLETVATGKPACAADLDHIQRLRRYADTVGFKRRVVRDGLLPDLLQLPASALAAATAVSPSKWLGALSLTRDRKASSMKSPLLEAQPSPKVSSHKRSPEISPLLSARTWAERRVEVLAGGDGGDGEDGGLAAAQGCPGMSPLAKHTSPASAKESARQKSSPHGKEAKGNARFFGDTADATDGAAGQRATLCAGAQRTGSADTHCDREWAAAGSPQAGTEHRDAGACDQSAAAHQGAHAAGLRGDGSGQVAQKEDGLHADAESSRDQSMGEEDVERMGEEEFERVDPELLHSLAALLRSESRVGVSCELASGEGGGQTEQEGSLAPETWAEMVARLKKTSPHGRRRGFRIETVIVKSFDDLRQEAFAMQLICELDAVWKACKVPVKVHCYRILPTSASAGLIEGLPEALSIDAVKKRCVEEGLGSLRGYFAAIYGGEGSAAFKLAQRNFAQSLAGYSMVQYVLQLKDRHNGNILLHADGHIIHIDFGFILGMSPGNLSFESAPFKLTDEYVALLDGVDSELWKEFVSCLQKAFLAVRRHHHRLTTLVEMASFAGAMPFCQRDSGGSSSSSSSYVVAGLLKRLELERTDTHCRAKIKKLATCAARSWSTAQYDAYQKLVNGIQP